jgi:hypothetical protein
MGDGDKTGIATGEQFQHFIYWLVSTHDATQFPDSQLRRLLVQEFPNRTRVLVNGDRYQDISDYRKYATPGRRRLLGIHSEAESAEVIARLAAKMPATHS